MKKIVTFFLAFAFTAQSFAAVNLTEPKDTEPARNAAQIFVPVGKTGKRISLMELSKISVAEFETLSDRDMKRMDETGFKLAQRKLRKSIQADGTIKAKKLKMFSGKITGGETGFHFGGFALGFFLGLIGVLLAYVVFEDDFKQNRIKWSWIGLGIGAILSIILIIVALNNVNDIYGG